MGRSSRSGLGGHARHWVLVALMCCATPIGSSPAMAADSAKFATTIARQAMAAYQAGDFPRAGQLYLQAYKADPKAEYLYAAARAEQLAGVFVPAVEHYRKARDLPDLDPALRAKCIAYVAEILAAQAESKAAEAEKAMRQGELRLAAQLFHDAFALAPGRWDWLFKAAMAEQAAGDLEAAERDYAAYVQHAPDQAEDRKQAQVRLETLRRPAPLPVAETKKPPQPATGPEPTAPPAEVTPVTAPTAAAGAVPAVVRAPQAEPAIERWLAWSAVGGGLALVAGGLALYAAQGEERATLDSAMAHQKDGKITGIGYDAYSAQRDSLNSAYRNAALLSGAGVVAGGLGVWLLLREPVKTVQVGPGPGGPGLSLAWGF